MTINFIKPALILISLCALSCSKITKNNATISGTNFYTQSHSNRLAAEWEPALGVMIVWPLSIPHKLVIELAKDNQLLLTFVENETSEKEAVKWYQKWGIDPAKIKFIYAPQGVDAWWVRDWGPGAVFSPDKTMKLADGKYIYSTPATTNKCTDTLTFWDQAKDNKIIKTQTDDQATVFIGQQLNQQVLDLPFINTGGNVLTDGLGTAFSTCILTNENRFYGISDEKFLKLNKELLGIKRYNILSNFEKEGIQHIDCYMKLLDEERILVMEPPKDHELYEIYQDIIQNELSRLKSSYGRPYTILRMQTRRYKNERLAAYVNAIIINKTVYVPLFKIEEDKAALQRWQEVMPGYTIKGFEFDLNDEPILSKEMKNHYQSDYGWNHGDALHCRVRAIWDPEMLFMSVKQIDAKVGSKRANKVYATIIDYSKKGLDKEKSKLFWRLTGETNWNVIPLNQIKSTGHFYAEIPYQNPGAHIEYYISAVSNSGRAETRPGTAPLGTYTYSIR